jgi:hypothetical protein
MSGLRGQTEIRKDGDKKGGLAIQCDKNEYRGILAVLEGVTGKKAGASNIG